MGDYSRRHSSAVQARWLQSPVPPKGSYTAADWLRVIAAMDFAKFGEARTKFPKGASLIAYRTHVAERVRNGENMPQITHEWQEEWRQRQRG